MSRLELDADAGPVPADNRVQDSVTTFEVESGLRPLLWTLVVLDLVLGAAYGLNYVIGIPLPGLARAIDLDGEGNPAAWYASLLWTLAGVLLLIAVWPQFDRRRRSSWMILVMPLMCFLCSLDETGQLHEYFGMHADRVLLPAGRVAAGLGNTGIGELLLAPIATVIVVLGVRALGQAFGYRRPGIRNALLAWGAFLLASTGAEMVSNLTYRVANLNALEVMIEETGENLAVTMLCFAALDLLVASGFRAVWERGDVAGRKAPGP